MKSDNFDTIIKTSLITLNSDDGLIVVVGVNTREVVNIERPINIEDNRRVFPKFIVLLCMASVSFIALENPNITFAPARRAIPNA